MRGVIGVLFTASLLGCMGWFQSEQTGFQALCDAPTTCPDCSEAQDDQRPKVLASHIETVVTNSTALQLFKKIRKAPAHIRAALLRQSAKEAGVESCGLADAWDALARTLSAEKLCNIPTRCLTFDKTDLDTIRGCVPNDDVARSEVERMPHDSPAAFARALESWSQNNGQDRCNLVHELRSP